MRKMLSQELDNKESLATAVILENWASPQNVNFIEIIKFWAQ